MSTLFLQGRLFLKTKDLIPKKELFDFFKSENILVFDRNIREYLEKKFASKEEMVNFVERDILHHLEIIRRETEYELRSFFQFLFLPFDWFRFLCIFSGKKSVSQVGYFKDEEMEEMVKKKSFPFTMAESLKKIFSNIGKKKEDELTREILQKRKEFFENLRLKNVMLYFRLFYSLDGKVEREAQKIFLKTIPLGNFYPLETFRFYLPLFFKKDIVYFENELEFLFFYFKERFILWKILGKEIV